MSLAEVKALVADYMDIPREQVDEKIADRIRVACNGATYGQVFTVLKGKWNEAGGKYGPQGKHGPKSAAWFVTVLRGHFQPEARPLPPGDRLSDERMNAMASAMDTTDDLGGVVQ